MRTSALIAGMLLFGGGSIFTPLPAPAKGGPPPADVVGPVIPASITKDGMLVESGSSNFYPLMDSWADKYQKIHTNVKFTTKNLESEAGILQVSDGRAHIGASEAYMSDAQLAEGKLLNIPLVVGAEQIVYNVPELGDDHLHLSGQALVGIYNGSIRFWDDAKLRALNPALSGALPHQRIVPIHGADGSGDTFVFSQYLESSDVSWRAGSGMTLAWPSVSNALNASGKQAVLGSCRNRAYSIAYLNVGMKEDVQQAGIGVAALENQFGKFVLPTPKTISAAALTFDHETPPDERVSLVGAPGDASYPIVMYEYAIVNPHQPDEATAEAIKNFLSWAIASNGGSDAQYLRAHFTPLPNGVAKMSQEQINAIQFVSP